MQLIEAILIKLREAKATRDAASLRCALADAEIKAAQAAFNTAWHAEQVIRDDLERTINESL